MNESVNPLEELLTTVRNSVTYSFPTINEDALEIAFVPQSSGLKDRIMLYSATEEIRGGFLVGTVH